MSNVADRYRLAAHRLDATLAAVSPDAWVRPSRCEGWTINDVVQHIVATEADFMRQRALPAPDIDGLDAVAAWPKVRDTMLGALIDPTVAGAPFDGFFGPTTIEETVERFYVVDLIVHRWDIADALALTAHATLADDELKAIESALADVPDAVLRSEGLFGPALEVAPDAPAQARVLGFIGRSG